MDLDIIKALFWIRQANKIRAPKPEPKAPEPDWRGFGTKQPRYPEGFTYPEQK